MRAIIWPGIAVSVIALFALVMKATHCAINATPSMPIGIYRQVDKQTVQRGDIVEVCLPQKVAEEGLRKHYLIKGHCPNGAIAVLKEVIAVPHDNVVVTEHTLIVNEKRFLAPRLTIDNEGKAVKQFIKNKSYNTINTYWLWGSNDPIYSWDSRYYGGVKKENITSVERPVWVL